MSLTNFITYCCIEYTSPQVAFEIKTLEVACIGNCKSNYHTITTTTPLSSLETTKIVVYIKIEIYCRVVMHLYNRNKIGKIQTQQTVYKLTIKKTHTILNDTTILCCCWLFSDIYQICIFAVMMVNLAYLIMVGPKTRRAH